MAQKPGPHDPRAVDRQHIARRNQRGEIGKGPVTDRAGHPIDHHESRRIPGRDRMLRDEVRREVEVVVGRAGAATGRAMASTKVRWLHRWSDLANSSHYGAPAVSKPTARALKTDCADAADQTDCICVAPTTLHANRGVVEPPTSNRSVLIRFNPCNPLLELLVRLHSRTGPVGSEQTRLLP